MQIPQKRETTSETKSLFVFNPEHDLALAVGSGPYTPPAEVVKIKNYLSLLPALYAGDSDFILLPCNISDKDKQALKYYDEAINKKIRILNPEEVPEVCFSIDKVIPWGWDHSVVNFLKEVGIPTEILPDGETIKEIRKLSHRRTSILIITFIQEFLNKKVKYKPQEIYEIKEIKTFLKNYPKAFFKSPWSSSGRGIVASDHISEKGLLEWCHGTIKKQGSIIAEPAWDKVFDFATEWWISDNKASFIGYSVFKTSSRGKYHGNLELSQKELELIIRENAPLFNEEIFHAQELALNKIIAPFYNGPLGIDMLVDKKGDINPCVELNLRLTMGFINIPEGRDMICKQIGFK